MFATIPRWTGDCKMQYIAFTWPILEKIDEHSRLP